MIDIKNLPEPQFVEIDWKKEIDELVKAYENSSGSKLSKGQLERLLLDIFAYRENILRILIQETAKQNLLAYAKGSVLDHLGALLGVERLSASKAITTLRFYFSEPLPSEMLIPKGTRVRSQDDKVIFATTESVNVQSGNSSIDIPAKCEEAGTVGNGYSAGSINKLIDPLPFIEKVKNISESYGGSDIESDEHFRMRIQLAPERFSNAGSRGAYEYWAKTAHQDIVDVSVYSLEPGTVTVCVLLKDGNIPDGDILDLVSDTLNNEKVRPLTDLVEVVAPDVVNYEIDVSLYLYESAVSLTDLIKQQANDILEQYTASHNEKLGADVVPEQIIGLLQKISGVYRAVVNKPSYTEVAQNQVAKCTNITITVAGSVNG